MNLWIDKILNGYFKFKKNDFTRSIHCCRFPAVPGSYMGTEKPNMDTNTTSKNKMRRHSHCCNLKYIPLILSYAKVGHGGQSHRPYYMQSLA